MSTQTTASKRSDRKAASRSKQSLRLWLRLLSCESIIEQHIRTRLRETFEITLPQFDVLAELEHVGEPLTMTELSKKLMVSNGNVTGVIDRLVRVGMVRRTPSKEDRRVQLIDLTTQGQAYFKEMAEQHEQWIAELFESLPASEISQLTDILSRTHEALKNPGRNT